MVKAASFKVEIDWNWSCADPSKTMCVVFLKFLICILLFSGNMKVQSLILKVNHRSVYPQTFTTMKWKSSE